MRRIATFLCFIAMLLLLAACDSTVKVSSSAGDYLTKDYEEAVAELQAAGFTNIEAMPDEDLTSTTIVNDGLIKTISIDGRTNFAAGEKFSPEAPVVISYHTIHKIRVPLRVDELQQFDYETVADYFTYAGFTDVEITTVNDLDPDELEGEYINEVQINGSNEFQDTDVIPFDAEIIIIRHLPYEKYKMRIGVNCKANMLFSKYDVDVYVDEEKIGTVEHGASREYELVVRDGRHTITFMKAESDVIKNEVAVDVQEHKDLVFDLTCGTSEITAEKSTDKEWKQITDHEVELRFSSSEYEKKNYEELEKALKAVGFTNIKTEAQYDILLTLLTKDGELASVSIDGRKGFEKGEVFEKNAQIIIKYHALKESQKK